LFGTLDGLALESPVRDCKIGTTSIYGDALPANSSSMGIMGMLYLDPVGRCLRSKCLVAVVLSVHVSCSMFDKLLVFASCNTFNV
jgi:hypothetical protein